MKALLAKHPIGIFAFDESGKLVYHRLFSRNPSEALEEYLKPLPELRGYEAEESIAAQKILRKTIRYHAKTLSGMNDIDFNRFLSEFGILISRKNMRGSVGRDRLVIQASKAAEDIEKTMNTYMERLGEWYRLHYPELRLSHKELVNKIIEHGKRENFPDFIESVGVHLSDEDENILKEYASLIKEKHDKKIKIEEYVRNTMKVIAPNTSSLIDPILGAKLMSMAGSLEKLARMPTSSIQLLGAEKALFRHIKKQGKSPKYGLIFQDQRIQAALPEQRGKVARLIASKLMQAARIDFYSGRHEPGLKKGLEEEIKSISDKT